VAFPVVSRSRIDSELLLRPWRYVASGDAEDLFAGRIELVGDSLVALGLASSIAAFVVRGEMAVAYFRAHAPIGFWPIHDGGEWQICIVSFSSMCPPGFREFLTRRLCPRTQSHS
jgi:hypothetical protein